MHYEADFKPYYKVELYVSVEGLQDLQLSKFARYASEVLGETVLEEIKKFTNEYQEDMKIRMVRETKLIVP